MSGSAGLILSSYAAAPALDGWNPEAEAALLHAAARLPGVSGLEIPFYPTGQLHKYDGDWFLEQVRHLPDHLAFVVTTIPDTMSRLDGSADFGLASLTAAGRQAAVARAAAAAGAVRTLNAALGRQAVLAVHLYSAPRPVSHGVPAGSAGTGPLAASLEQLAAVGWDGARPVLEHCDAAKPGQTPVKGFITLEEELEAVTTSGTGTGVAVNWGRSAIEGRNGSAADRHIGECLDSELLAGVVLSGCAPVATRFGEAWDDCHVPPAPVEPASLLTPAAIRSVSAALESTPGGPNSEVYRGLKVSAPRGSSVARRVGLLSDSIDVVRAAGF
ncbi:conserved hypothetical protein [Pseudarthrobacter chlorophenolicus A6]|uniref:DUF4862 domain-containing protein n=1 Tax=Pseudarthrobacter chlorophenolicus (strain ATCC 700700 / DSM 12829 / CIP 107037 / JCM 12360 / KCTC 9906 / NCIMB 13794 / A6) TaxID=452863 RepID=B8HE74_PSECP|nr:DUF4862 family protein [Pseudarthrobacter chlorophenolicus]ACL39109.1 conserved hypothetical protein [Pseudarthrobacter chlorophenolicus A6]SDR04299.1 protein of unknown function [Pseudarthrobacter chlorophenolicus]